MGRNYFLDKDIIKDKNDNIYIVLTNYNPSGYIFAYIKYVYTGKGIWKGYERVFPYYGVKNLMKLNQKFEHEPCYDASFPILNISDIKYHYKPEEKIKEFIEKSHNTKLEILALELLSKIRLNLKIGIGGSLLLGIHHPNSDIDFIVYGKKDIEDFINNFEGFEEDKDWIYETAKNYSLSVDAVKTLYTKKTRGVYKGVKYSFLFVDDKPWKYCENICKRMAEVELEGEIEGDVNSLIYPSSAIFYAKNDVYTILSYEGIFSYLLYKGGKARVRGMLMLCKNGEKLIVIGDREVGGYIRSNLP